MINVQTSQGIGLSLSFVQVNRTFGDKGIRACIECDVYANGPSGMEFINRGISICNPADAFNPRIGAHKAVQSALTRAAGFTKEDRQAVHDQVESWFQ